MGETYITDLTTYMHWIENERRAYFQLGLFRGQDDAVWELRSSYHRELCVVHRENNSGNFGSMLNEWKRRIEPYRDVDLTEIQLAAIAQHYGLKTPLLDWSNNPLVALYFAVSNECYDRVCGRVFYTVPSTGYRSKGALNELGHFQRVLCPPVDRRIAAQSGCFTYDKGRNADSESLDVKGIKECLICAKAKEEIRKRLDAWGINRSTLYPDVQGVSEYLNWYEKAKAAHVSEAGGAPSDMSK